jgi:hypothetical protein
MAPQFNKHYTLQEARALLPQIRIWLEEALKLQQSIQQREPGIAARLSEGDDLGGPIVNASLRSLAELKRIVDHFQELEIQIKDLERGLIDFPAYIGGKEVFLCWEKDEDDIEFWHDLESGYGGREKIKP